MHISIAGIGYIICTIYASGSHCTKCYLRNSTKVPSAKNYLDDIHITKVCWGYVIYASSFYYTFTALLIAEFLQF